MKEHIVWRPSVYLDPKRQWERWDGRRWVTESRFGVVMLQDASEQWRVRPQTLYCHPRRVQDNYLKE